MDRIDDRDCHQVIQPGDCLGQQYLAQENWRGKAPQYPMVY